MKQILLLSLLALLATPVFAHPLDPAFLQVIEASNGRVNLHWSGSQTFVQGVHWQLPSACTTLQSARLQRNAQRWLGHQSWHCTAPLAAASVGGADVINGTRLMLDFQGQNQNASTTTLINVEHGRIQLPATDTGFNDTLQRFATLGIEHILMGVDHLLFVFCLVLLFRSPRKLLLPISAFTLGHSLTLLLCTTHLLQVPTAWAECCIALSLMLLCRELMIPAQNASLIRRQPWLVTTLFGLVHGMGFASALQEIGIGEGNVLLKVVSFNVGVEIGQLLFIALVLAGLQSLQRWLPDQSAVGQRLTQIIPLGAGTLASLWFFERLAGGL